LGSSLVVFVASFTCEVCVTGSEITDAKNTTSDWARTLSNDLPGHVQVCETASWKTKNTTSKRIAMAKNSIK
jgi:hypothetical protein